MVPPKRKPAPVKARAEATRKPPAADRARTAVAGTTAATRPATPSRRKAARPRARPRERPPATDAPCAPTEETLAEVRALEAALDRLLDERERPPPPSE